jgi:NAD(P)H-dependent FMN reductase
MQAGGFGCASVVVKLYSIFYIAGTHATGLPGRLTRFRDIMAMWTVRITIPRSIATTGMAVNGFSMRGPRNVTRAATSNQHDSPRTIIEAASMNITVIVGSVRSDRIGIRAARFVVRSFRERGHDVTLVDPAETALPLLDRMYKEYPKGEAPAPLEALAGLYRATDAFVVVSGEYNHSIPPALSNLLDHFLEEYFFRPSAIVSYSSGQFGGVRAAMQLRALLAELGMSSIPSTLPIPSLARAISEEGEATDAAWPRRFARFAGELEWYAAALRNARVAGVPY